MKVICGRSLRKYVSANKANTLCNAFISGQFYYVPIILMFANQIQIRSNQNLYIPLHDYIYIYIYIYTRYIYIYIYIYIYTIYVRI